MANPILIEMIENLTIEDQEKVMEYASQFHPIDERPPHWNDELEAQYRQYILDGIAEGEKAIREGRVYTTEEARKILSSYLNK